MDLKLATKSHGPETME